MDGETLLREVSQKEEMSKVEAVLESFDILLRFMLLRRTR
jgi:hypothetical protein